MASGQSVVASIGPLFGVIGAVAAIAILYGLAIGIGRAWDRHLAKQRVRRLR